MMKKLNTAKVASKTLHAPHYGPVTMAIGLLIAGLHGTGHAQNTDATKENAVTDDTLQSVLITSSRKRAESVQDVPTSMKVFSPQTLEDAHVTQITDFIGLTPNASIVKSQSAGVSFITIRGLSQVRNGEAPVAMVIDGVPIPNSKSFTLELSDLRSVEILRGPQGAIYGRNAPGGAMVITTVPPSGVTSGFVEAGFGQGNERNTKGAVSGQLIPNTLEYRIGGSFVDRDGYFENTNLGRKMDPYRDGTLRGALRWTATDKLSVDLRGMASNTTGGANNFLAQTILYDPKNPCHLDPAKPFGGSAADPNRVSRTFCNSYVGKNDRNIMDFSAKIDYQMPFATATVIAAYNKVKEFESGTQYPYTATTNLFGVLNGSQTQYTDDTAKSIEFRLVSQDSGPLRWMAGAQLQHTDGFISTSTGSDTGDGIRRLTYDPQFGSTSNPTLSWLADTNHDKASSLFGNIEYVVSKSLSVSAGFRYDRDRRSQDVDPRQLGGVPPGCTPAAPDQCVNRANFSSVQPTAAVRYAFSPEFQVYATAGKGFRSGLFNQNGAAAAATAFGVIGVKDMVSPETTKSYELGFKREHDGLRIEGAVFQTKVSGEHYFLFIPSISSQVLANIDKVTLSGGEIEAAATLATGLDVYAGVGVTQSKIDEYKLNPAAVGNWAPYVPKVSVNLGAEYKFPIGNGFNVMTRADLISKGKQYWDPENAGARSTVNLLNLNVALMNVPGKWSIHLAITNATNRSYNEEFVAGGFATPANPRVVRIDFRKKF